MQRKNIFAFTEPGLEYPGYISVNQSDSKGDLIEVAVRTPRSTMTAAICLTHEQALALADSLKSTLDRKP